MISTIYVPKGKAKEYGDYALNLFEGCPHGCVYCFAPNVIKKDREQFHSNAWIRGMSHGPDTILNDTKKWFEKHPEVKGKHIHLCFTCDPYPYQQYSRHKVTDRAIEIIHESGNFVQILTKGDIQASSMRMLQKEDIFGVTISCSDKLARVLEPNALEPSLRLQTLVEIKEEVGCKTFVSCEPVFEPTMIYNMIENCDSIDEFKIGKLNYMSKDNPLYPDIDWKSFGECCETMCEANDRKYYIKEGLRAEMRER